MSKHVNINACLILLTSVAFTFITTGLGSGGEGQSAYGWGFIFGRSFAGALVPLFLVVIVRLIFRRKPLLSNWAIVAWWALFVLMSFLALLGSLRPPPQYGA